MTSCVALTRRALLALALLAGAGLAAPARSEAPLPAPSGTPVLTVSGNVARANQDGQAVFDRAMLEALGTVTVETSNPWVQGVARYEGVPLRRVLQAAGVPAGGAILAIALDNYTVEIPAADYADDEVILALRENGVTLSARNKGPLFVVYPFDARPGFRNELYFSRSIWQLTRIEVKP